MAIYLDYDGVPVSGDDLVWLAVNACGCATGAICVSIGSTPIAITEQAARREMNETATKARKDRRRYELALRATVSERLAICTHIDKEA